MLGRVRVGRRSAAWSVMKVAMMQIMLVAALPLVGGGTALGQIAEPAGLNDGQGLVQALPSPPMLDRYLFEQPWPVGVGSAALGVLGATLVLRRGGKVALAAVSVVAGALICGAVFVTAAMVETPREVIGARTRQLVDAVVSADTARTGALLASDVRLVYAGTSPAGLERGAILNRMEAFRNGPLSVRQHSIRRMQAHMDGAQIGRTQVQVMVEPEATRFPTYSWWRLDWRQEPDGEWRVFWIESLAIDGLPRMQR